MLSLVFYFFTCADVLIAYIKRHSSVQLHAIYQLHWLFLTQLHFMLA